MFFNVTPLDSNAFKAVAKVASALQKGTKKGAVVFSDQDEHLFKVMGLSESETMKVNPVDLETWLYRWVEKNLDAFDDEGGWIESDKIPGFLNFDIRIEEGELHFIPWDEELGEHVMDESEALISLKGIDTSYEQIITTVRNDTGEFVVTKGFPCRFSYDNPTVYFYDPRFEGRFGQYVSSYYVKTFKEIGEGKGLMMDGAVSTHILTPANVAHIKSLL